MSYSHLGYEHELFRASVRAFAEEHCEPGAATRDREAQFPRDIHRKMADNDMLGVGLSEDYGGSGTDSIALAILVEELARIDVGSSMIPFLNRACVLPWEVAGDHQKLETYGPKIARGDMIGAYAVTEPSAGSDVSSIRTTAIRDGNSWILSGNKRFISNGSVADIITVLAKTSPNEDHRGMSFFVVPTNARGVQVVRTEDKLGIRSSPTAELAFDDVQLTEDAVVGDVDRGFYYAMGTFDRSRVSVAAQAVGVAQGALELAIRYLESREQFGEALINMQGLRWMLADMMIGIESARIMTYEAHQRIQAADEKEITRWAAMAKVHASDVAMKVTTDALQLLGGSGYMTDLPAERFLRDAKILQIYEGTNQVLRNVIASRLTSKVDAAYSSA